MLTVAMTVERPLLCDQCRRRPARFSGRRLGLALVLCSPCYSREDRRQRYSRRVAERDPDINAVELEARIAAVRAVKDGKRPNGRRYPTLTKDELDRALPEESC